MKPTNEENRPIAEAFPFKFESVELDLKGWGEGDFYCIEHGVLILLEVERSQNHPNTNVLKYWPYIEERHNIKALLIQVIVKSKKKISANRIKLCGFMGEKLENLFSGRFKYHFMNWPTANLEEEIKTINNKLNQLI